MGGMRKSAGKNFDFKIKIIQTDLLSSEYLLGMGGTFGYDGDPAMYQNSNYISKLWFLNTYSGGILAKDKIEDMPESYRRFTGFENMSEAKMLKNFKKEMVMQKNREQIGQNVFYNQLSNQTRSDKLNRLEDIEAFIEEALYADADLEDEDEDIENENEQYEDDEEIRDILHLNNVYNSEMYKMSKVEYDFSAPGDIGLTKEGLFEIKYDDTEMTGIDGSYVRILFGETSRDVVTFHKKNFFCDWFALEKGKRVSIERTGEEFGSVAATHTKELVNTITLAGGELRTVYTMQINGVPTEAISYSIHASKKFNV